LPEIFWIKTKPDLTIIKLVSEVSILPH